MRLNSCLAVITTIWLHSRSYYYQPNKECVPPNTEIMPIRIVTKLPPEVEDPKI